MGARFSVIMTGALWCAAALPAHGQELAVPVSTTPPLPVNGSVELATPVNLLPLAAALQTEYPGASSTQVAWAIYRENPGAFALTADGPEAMWAHLALPSRSAVWQASPAQAAAGMQALTPRLTPVEFAAMTAPGESAGAAPAEQPSLRLAGDYVEALAPVTGAEIAAAVRDRYPRARPEQIQWALFRENPDAFGGDGQIQPGTILRLPTPKRVAAYSPRHAQRALRTPPATPD